MTQPEPLFTDQAIAGWRRFSAASVRGFHAYGTWLASISWGRFILLSVAFMIVVGMLSNLPPFSWTYTETVEVDAPAAKLGGHKIPLPPKPPVPPRIRIEKDAGSKGKGVDISIGEDGIHIRSTEKPASAPHVAASEAAAAASAASGVQGEPRFTVDASDKGIRIVVPADANSEDVKAAVEEARQAIVDAMEETRKAEAEAAAEAAQAQAEMAAEMAAEANGGRRVRTHTVSYGESLPPFAFMLIVLSAVLKATYKGRLQAEVKAAQATETAEAESLKRQVMEARMAAMQAQVEPHFLFNTLASIDHLIETDPPRASQMQKNLIALLRASMPTMRDTGQNPEGAIRDLGRELAVVRPYVEILKVRMEERLDARIEVPEGLLSAEFPSMMIQTLVENAIRHGLEPKAEGGQLRVRAEIVHGKLAVTVADTGVGFGNAATAGTGVGLANIRERLQLLHGKQATLTVTANQPSGTVVCITVPYRSVGKADETEA
jgi:signal transduction histidine kinase